MLKFFLAISVVFFLSSCKLLPFLKEVPFLIKTVIEGQIKDQPVRCERLINLAEGKWGDMCDSSSNVQIKYRARKVSRDEIRLEFAVSKIKGDRQKMIATPMMIVKNNLRAKDVATTKSSHLTITAESINQ